MLRMLGKGKSVINKDVVSLKIDFSKEHQLYLEKLWSANIA